MKKNRNKRRKLQTQCNSIKRQRNMKFNQLSESLGITINLSVSKKLELLQKWFQENVSTDIHFSGNEQFEQYKQATELYLAIILPEMSQDISKPNQKFNGDNLISALSTMGFDRVLSALKPEPALLNTKNSNGLTPLHQAALEGNYNTIKILLSLGADPSILNKRGQNPLFSALILPFLHDTQLVQNKVKIFRLLKDKGNQILNHQDDSGNTVLHQMALHGLENLIKEMLTTNLDLAYIKNNHIHYPIHTAILNNQIKSVIPLLKIENGANLEDSNGWMSIHYAARYADKKVIEECCKLITDIDATDLSGRTPLMIAAELGRLKAVKTLIEHNADVDFTDSQRFSVLHHSVKSGNLELVRWLIENTSVDINAKDNQDNTPLDICKMTLSETGSMNKISELLLEYGAKTTSFKF